MPSTDILEYERPENIRGLHQVLRYLGVLILFGLNKAKYPLKG